MSDKPHITVCICTYKRLGLLRRLLEALGRQSAQNDFTFSCAIADNDVAGSAQSLVEEFRQRQKFEISYAVEPERNFACVRNRVVSLARGDFIAFIDDDEKPVDGWLLELYSAMQRFSADGVLGPVRPYFDSPPPKWLIKSRLCDRPVHSTGLELNWNQTRSGNVLLKKSLFDADRLAFDPVYRTGGEDVDFFKRAMKIGRRFFWCEEAAAYELLPPERCRQSYFLKRALLQGRISLKYATEKMSPVAQLKIGLKCSLAIFGYTLLLPFLCLAGMGVLMKYLVKDCHHLGRLLALLKVPVWKERNF